MMSTKQLPIVGLTEISDSAPVMNGTFQDQKTVCWEAHEQWLGHHTIICMKIRECSRRQSSTHIQ